MAQIMILCESCQIDEQETIHHVAHTNTQHNHFIYFDSEVLSTQRGICHVSLCLWYRQFQELCNLTASSAICILTVPDRVAFTCKAVLPRWPDHANLPCQHFWSLQKVIFYFLLSYLWMKAQKAFTTPVTFLVFGKLTEYWRPFSHCSGCVPGNHGSSWKHIAVLHEKFHYDGLVYLNENVSTNIDTSDFSEIHSHRGMLGEFLGSTLISLMAIGMPNNPRW